MKKEKQYYVSYKEDDFLVADFYNGNEQAFNTLNEKYLDSLTGYCRTFIRNYEDADDAVQRTLIKAYGGLKRKKYLGDNNGKYNNWLFRIARNVCLDHFRVVKKKLSIDSSIDTMKHIDGFITTKEKSPEELYFKKERTEALEKMVDSLCENQTDVIRRNVFGDVLLREIAEEKGLSINTVLGHKHYAICNLRKEAKKEQYKDLF